MPEEVKCPNCGTMVTVEEDTSKDELIRHLRMDLLEAWEANDILEELVRRWKNKYYDLEDEIGDYL